MAESYFRGIISGDPRGDTFEVFSAGVFATPGRRADPRARDVAASMGVQLDQHTAKMISAEDVSRADIVCVMDDFNEVVCLSRFVGIEGKLVRLGALGREPGEGSEIEDPFGGDTETIRACFERITRSVDVLWKKLSSL